MAAPGPCSRTKALAGSRTSISKSSSTIRPARRRAFDTTPARCSTISSPPASSTSAISGGADGPDRDQATNQTNQPTNTASYIDQYNGTYLMPSGIVYDAATGTQAPMNTDK